MDTESTTLIVVIANLIIQPLLQYLLHSRCSHIKVLGCVECDREIMKSKEEKEDNTEQEQIEF
jgi:hypothetical protein|tara:strand:- start:1374 stop:1562 length:189 start_codon:yes stop_codon:yes gene_type:complete